MAYTNNFLVLEVNPANNESNISVNSPITVKFAMDMAEGTINAGTLLLSKVNGSAVACSVTYNRPTRTAVIQPTASLDGGTQYQIVITGGPTGVQTITGQTMIENKVYAFTTTYGIAISEPKSLEVSLAKGHITLKWLQPDVIDPAYPVTYEATITPTNLPEVNTLWPLETDHIGVITTTQVNAAVDLPDGHYYASVRAKSNSIVTNWINTQFDVASSSAPVSGPVVQPMGTFEIAAVYPKAEMLLTKQPANIKILFTENIDIATVTSSSVYVVQGNMPKELQPIDLITDYSPTSPTRYAVTIDPMTAPTNVISLTLPANDPNFVFNKNYTVVLRENIKSASGESLGQAYGWEFAAYDPFYGDPDLVRETVASIISGLSDDVLYGYMAAESYEAYTVASQQKGFDAVIFKQNPPDYIHKYVNYSTIYDLLVDAYIQKSGKIGDTRQLGDLSITYNGALSDITSLLDEYQLRIKMWEDLLHGHHNRGYAKPDATGKRGDAIEPYPQQMSNRHTLRDLGQ